MAPGSRVAANGGKSTHVPGATGVKQCFASGQQNSVALHASFGTHGCDAVTHSLVNGQQSCPVPHEVALAEHETPVGAKQALASGQQNSATEQLDGGAGGGGDGDGDGDGDGGAGGGAQLPILGSQ